MNFKINNKITGVNLVSLIIGSALGVFLLTVIVKISISINNNHQFIKANLELTISARQLTNFFTQAFIANGYIEQPVSPSAGVTDQTIVNQNFFGINTNGGKNETRFYLWYSAGINNALSCNGQPLTAQPSSNPATWLRISLNNNTGNIYTQCNDSTLGGNNLPPIVSPQQFQSFFLVATANLSSSVGSNLINILIDATPPSKLRNRLTTYGNARGVKLAVILRSSKPVFNTARTTNFTVFNQSFSSTDNYLYKLVIIQVPFMYTINNITNSLTTQICDFSINNPTPCAYGNPTDNQK